MTPPYWQIENTNFIWIAPVFLLTIIGFYGLFYIPFFVIDNKEKYSNLTYNRRLISLGALIIFIFSWLPESSYDYDKYRCFGFWKIAYFFPTIPIMASRSLLFGILYDIFFQLDFLL